MVYIVKTTFLETQLTNKKDQIMNEEKKPPRKGQKKIKEEFRKISKDQNKNKMGPPLAGLP